MKSFWMFLSTVFLATGSFVSQFIYDRLSWTVHCGNEGYLSRRKIAQACIPDC